jgi:hypothetical protein
MPPPSQGQALSCGIWFADGDQTQSQRGAVLAADPDRPVDPIVGLRQFSVDIDRLALLIQPTRIAPAGPHYHDLPLRRH